MELARLGGGCCSARRRHTLHNRATAEQSDA
jgi:hypothetical protein